MKTPTLIMSRLIKVSYLKEYLKSAFIAAILATIISCNNNDNNTQNSNPAGYKQVNLVSDIGGYSAIRTDTNLQNAWGIAISPEGAFWIAANHSNLGVIYDRNGAELSPPVSLNTNGAPTG